MNAMGKWRRIDLSYAGVSLVLTAYAAANYEWNRFHGPLLVFVFLVHLGLLPLYLQLRHAHALDRLASLDWRGDLALTMLQPLAYLRGRIVREFRFLPWLLIPVVLQVGLIVFLEGSNRGEVFSVLLFLLMLGLGGLLISLMGLMLRLVKACRRGGEPSGQAVMLQIGTLVLAYGYMAGIFFAIAKWLNRFSDISTMIAGLIIINIILLTTFFVLLELCASRYFKFED